MAQTLEPGASVSIVARRDDINANQPFTWPRTVGTTRSAAEGKTTRVVPAVVTGKSSAMSAAPAAEGRIKSALAGGNRVIANSMVDATALARLIKVLSRR